MARGQAERRRRAPVGTGRRAESSPWCRVVPVGEGGSERVAQEKGSSLTRGPLQRGSGEGPAARPQRQASLGFHRQHPFGVCVSFYSPKNFPQTVTQAPLRVTEPQFW